MGWFRRILKKIRLKIFYSEIQKDHQAIAAEELAYPEIPMVAAVSVNKKVRRYNGRIKKYAVEMEIVVLGAVLESKPTASKAEAYQRIQLLQDSLTKFIDPAGLDTYYKNKITKFEHKNAKWTGLI